MYWYSYHQPESLRYMAPERMLGYIPVVGDPSKEGDVYSLAMTSFLVCASFGTIILLEIIVPLQSDSNGGIALSWKYSGGHDHRYSCWQIGRAHV